MRIPVVDRPLFTLVHTGLRVPVVTGGSVPYINLDHAASAAPLRAVTTAVNEYVDSGQYSAIHRGMGWPSVLSTNMYEDCRSIARQFFNAPDDSAVIWTNNTTGGINTVAHAFGPNARIVAFAFEHHANLLPWQYCDLTLLPVPPDHATLLWALENELLSAPVDLVTVTGASNVTGERPPLAQIAKLAHYYGARVLVDAAQLAPHHVIDMQALGADWVVCSGHKLGAPHGVGVVVGDPLPNSRAPLIRGGAVVDFVLPDGTPTWLGDPQARYEPGSPHVVGVLATTVAMETLMAADRARIALEEHTLLALAAQALASVPGLTLHRMWPGTPRTGILTFTVAGIPYAQLAAILSAEYGIGTRHGCFCAHPLIAHLLGVGAAQARQMGAQRHSGGAVVGAVRCSIGLDTTFDSVLELVDALLRITKTGPRWTYQLTSDTAHCWPDPDPRWQAQ